MHDIHEQAAVLNEANLYFEDQRDVFVREHHGEFVLIYGGEAVGFFPDRAEAYREGKASSDGIFLIRECLRKDEEQPAVFHSRVGV